MTVIPIECRFCALLEEVRDPLPGEEGYYRCSAGRFDIETPSGTIPQFFAWSGIWRPNKKVSATQRNCPHFKQHPQVIFISRKGRPDQR